jgi:hypothetical protein
MNAEEIEARIRAELEERRLWRGGWTPPVTHLIGSKCRQSEFASGWNETVDETEVTCLNCLRYLRQKLSGKFFRSIR